jgi:BlaI family transcriptional regulator, penicillinase repressor
MPRNGKGHLGLSTAQLELMNILWEKGEATVTDIWSSLPKSRPLARTTVMTVLSRLAGKGILSRLKEKNEIVYRPAVPKDAVLGNLLTRLVDTAFAGSAANLVMTLVDARGISSKEATHLRKIIAASTKGGRS